MYAKKNKIRYGRWALSILIIFPPALWYIASPVVAVNFFPNSTEEFHYAWNTQHRIYRGNIKHGGSAVEFSHIFPDKKFFMMFDWWTNAGFQNCIYITPKWGRTIDIYLDKTGRIDSAKTGPEVMTRLKPCKQQ